MNWTRSETIGLARAGCRQCWGIGLIDGRGNIPQPCGCVCREIFRECLRRYKVCAIPRMQARLLRCAGGLTWSRMGEEFRADVWLLARRTLDGPHWRVFILHHVHGWDWRICCRRLGLSRGNFFHAVYRIEVLVGRAMREVGPHSLHPTDAYFQGRPAINAVRLAFSHQGGRQWRLDLWLPDLAAA